MIIAMSGFLGSMIADRFGGATAWSLTGLIVIGLWTVHHWSATEDNLVRETCDGIRCTRGSPFLSVRSCCCSFRRATALRRHL